MRQTDLKLTEEDREQIGEICAKGVRQVREVNRAHVLAALVCSTLGVAASP